MYVIFVSIAGYISPIIYHTAQNLDGVNVKGYMATSLMDSFEWLRGYQQWFGLHRVDFKNPSLPRTPKRSAHYYSEIVKNNGLPIPEEEKFLYETFPEDFRWSTASSSYQVGQHLASFLTQTHRN